jgi:hypothetical protein
MEPYLQFLKLVYSALMQHFIPALKYRRPSHLPATAPAYLVKTAPENVRGRLPRGCA